MKTSNKILLGGFLLPIVICLGSILLLSLNSTDDPMYQLGDNQSFNMNLGENIYF